MRLEIGNRPNVYKLRDGADDEGTRSLFRAMVKKITWWQAAEIIGVRARTMRRWQERLEEDGYDGLADRRKGVVSPKRVSLEPWEQVLGLYRERYYDLNMRHFHEKLEAEHGIELSYTWVQKALQGAGLVAKRSKRGKHRGRRPRRPMVGMLLHIDGSKHCWFQNSQRYDLIVILDDATSEIYYAQLVEEESTRTVMTGLREVQSHSIMELTGTREQSRRATASGRSAGGARAP